MYKGKAVKSIYNDTIVVRGSLKNNDGRVKLGNGKTITNASIVATQSQGGNTSS